MLAPAVLTSKLSFCLYEHKSFSFVFLLSHPAFVKFRSLVLARDDVSQVLCCSVGIYLFLDRRT